MQNPKELRVSWIQSRPCLCNIRYMISIELMEGIPGRPFAGELDVFMPRSGTTIIEPFLNFLMHVICVRQFGTHEMNSLSWHQAYQRMHCEGGRETALPSSSVKKKVEQKSVKSHVTFIDFCLTEVRFF